MCVCVRERERERERGSCKGARSAALEATSASASATACPASLALSWRLPSGGSERLTRSPPKDEEGKDTTMSRRLAGLAGLLGRERTRWRRRLRRHPDTTTATTASAAHVRACTRPRMFLRTHVRERASKVRVGVGYVHVSARHEARTSVYHPPHLTTTIATTTMTINSGKEDG
jgi:hypothetical protein